MVILEDLLKVLKTDTDTEYYYIDKPIVCKPFKSSMLKKQVAKIEVDRWYNGTYCRIYLI